MSVKINGDVRSALELLGATDPEKKAKVVLDLRDLALEPEPAEDGWHWDSKRVGFLWQQNYKVRRLRLRANLSKHRFFYHYDSMNECVYVMELVKKDKNTYLPNAPHIQRVKSKYDDYYRRRLWQA